MAQLWQPHRVDLKATAAPIHCQSIQTVWNPDGWQVKSARCLRAVAFYASAHVGFTMTREERMAGRVHTLLLTRKTVGPATSRRSSLIRMATPLRRRGEVHEVHAACVELRSLRDRYV